MDVSREWLEVLSRIRDNQEKQLSMQTEALALQRQNFELVKRQFDRAERLQERAEKIQDSSAKLVKVARKSLYLVLPVLIGLIAYVSWLIFIV